MNAYCTYFDRNYLLRALALYRSLRDVGDETPLYGLCLDDASYRLVDELGLPGFVPVRLEDLEAFDPEVAGVKGTRSRVEYFFTLTPALPLFLLDRHPDIEWISYLDADLFFYSHPRAVLEVIGDGSVGIIPHGFPDHLRHLEVHGRYNVGMVVFRNDEAGRACLERWRRRCIEWCYDRVEDGKFADQAYLDDWPEVHEGVVVVDRPGIGLGPWNYMRFRIDVEGQPPTVDGEPLVFYHFHAFRSLGMWLYYDGLSNYGTMDRRTRHFLYSGYIRALRRVGRELDARDRPIAKTSRGHSRVTLARLVDLARHRRLMIGFGDRVLAITLATGLSLAAVVEQLGR
jgi:hypothetical protein